MKHCPSCNFSFPDFHQVCDFDGTELVADPSRPRVVNTSSRRLTLLRSMKSPVLWAALLLIFVLSTAFLTAYLDATRQPAFRAQAQPSPASVAHVVPAPDQVSTEVKPSEPARESNARISTERSTFVGRQHRLTPGRTQARLAQRTPGRERSARRAIARSQNSQVAQRGDSRQDSQEQEPKFTAVLKTTWRVLKWPFRF